MLPMLRHVLFTAALISGIASAEAQNIIPPVNYNAGIGFVAPDSLYTLNMRFRMQSRIGYTTVSESDLSAAEIEARVRRARLRFDGFMFDPDLTYYLQLGFTRGDMDWTDNENSAINSSPNVLRDAIVTYRFTDNYSVTFGQTKLPGNRSRVVSSSEMQFTDRAVTNATFNIDRDFGVQMVYQNKISNFHYVIRGALTGGEGRNAVMSDAGLAYTGRIELLPFGKFTNRGDYFEGDLEREQEPKLSLAGGYHYNEHAMRTGGTIGRDLYAPVDMQSIIADFVFKYKGFAVAGEYFNRDADDPVTFNETEQVRVVYTGVGTMLQMSYLFQNDLEVAARYAMVTPQAEIQSYELQKDELGLCVTKYLRKHRVKLQSQVFYNTGYNMFSNESDYKEWTAMFQVEFGI